MSYRRYSSPFIIQPPQGPAWKTRLRQVIRHTQYDSRPLPEPWPAIGPIYYLIGLHESEYRDSTELRLDLRTRGTGIKNAFRKLSLSAASVSSAPDPLDAQILRMLCGVIDESDGWYSHDGKVPHHVALDPLAIPDVIPLLCRTNRLLLQNTSGTVNPNPLVLDDAGPWTFRLSIVPLPGTGAVQVQGNLVRGDSVLFINDVELVHDGLLIHQGKVALLDDSGSRALIETLRLDPEFRVPRAQLDAFLAELCQIKQLPPVEFDPELNIESTVAAPRPRLFIQKRAMQRGHPYGDLTANVSFDYGGVLEPCTNTGSAAMFIRDGRRFIRRDTRAEETFIKRLKTLKFTSQWAEPDAPRVWSIRPTVMPPAVAALTSEGWHVEAAGTIYRNAGSININVATGIDWFDVTGNAQFGDAFVPLPRLLQAIRKGESTVVLDDGSIGMVPQQWLSKYRLLAGAGEAEGDGIRFLPSQLGLLDAMLASQNQVVWDEAAASARARLAHFDGVSALDAPQGFVGTLRPYQREGLGWIQFLREFRLGGCLADDMGLGKTIQVLAALLERHHRIAAATGDEPRTSLVVVPRSLVFNWHQEATRFAPQLRLLDHTSTGRPRNPEAFKDVDLVLTTYGTLRSDITWLKDYPFDYAILDEAQAVKNSASQSAKAVRLLNARHRLALSGTPVQNHLGELWSLFDFLNPGMLGSSSILQTAGQGKSLDPEVRTTLARALRPYILRRTKEQVAPELPEKLQQTVWCDLGPKQRELYDQLRDHYRQALLAHVDSAGIKKSQIQILEALLRLRQAACHPALLDKAYAHESSAKIDALLSFLDQIADEGHKALVFSQFTSLLAIVKAKLDEKKIVYEYLDGQTRDRQQRVERFQTDPDCKLFLISLKAGGLGLNLTAADYVYLLDPWWNPAAEAQAIDRAHRIGQTRRVFAYRLIARDTVEEKVLQLQETKRELANAIIDADNSVLSRIGREELQLLLS
jgi:superfamily II DNA or RNA helicase